MINNEGSWYRVPMDNINGAAAPAPSPEQIKILQAQAAAAGAAAAAARAAGDAKYAQAKAANPTLPDDHAKAVAQATSAAVYKDVLDRGLAKIPAPKKDHKWLWIGGAAGGLLLLYFITRPAKRPPVVVRRVQRRK